MLRLHVLFRLAIRGQSENDRKTLAHTKTHLGRSPQGVFGVHYYLVTACSAMQPAATAGTACVTLVNTSVYLKPAKLINVAFDVLARLAPCLNLGVRELGHKDLLDTIGADNCRK